MPSKLAVAVPPAPILHSTLEGLALRCDTRGVTHEAHGPRLARPSFYAWRIGRAFGWAGGQAGKRAGRRADLAPLPALNTSSTCSPASPRTSTPRPCSVSLRALMRPVETGTHLPTCRVLSDSAFACRVRDQLPS